MIELKSVIKRDGSTVPYNRDKIVIAIQKANAEVEPEERVTDEQIDGIVRLIEKRKCKRMLGRRYSGYHRDRTHGLREIHPGKDIYHLSLFARARQEGKYYR